MLQSELFLRTFKRRIEVKRTNLAEDFISILDRIEELTAGILTKRNFTGKKENLKFIFDALNDLADSINFCIEVIVPSRLRYYAFRDQLTDVFNRHYLREKVNELYNHPEKFPVGIIFVDLDDLKYVNDNFGHHVGDLYITQAAEILKNSVREKDYIFRFGGDEFLILIPNADETLINNILLRINKNLKEYNKLESLKFPLTFSIGTTLWKNPSEPFSKIIQKADEDMYKNKEKKNNN